MLRRILAEHKRKTARTLDPTLDSIATLERAGAPRASVAADAVPVSPREWFAAQGWSPFAFQEEVWAAYGRGESGLIHAPTGMGKTYAASGPSHAA